MTEINVVVKYPAGHTYIFEYYKSELYCPNCGEKTVWIEQGEGDYYEGPTHVCISCLEYFSMPRQCIAEIDGSEIQIIDQIKKGLNQ